jgi:hypothetical protein
LASIALLRDDPSGYKNIGIEPLKPLGCNRV